MTSLLARLPATCAVAFKEWAGVCDALATGRQALIFRKGGITEAPGGFSPDHPAFWLYPTHVHEAEQGLRSQLATPSSRSLAVDSVDIDALAVVEVIRFVASDAALPAFDELHEWTHETLLKRFHYRRPGIWLLGVRVYRRPSPWALEVTPDYAGCRTWVVLERPLSTDGLEPVLDDDQHARLMERLRSMTDPAS